MAHSTVIILGIASLEKQRGPRMWRREGNGKGRCNEYNE